ncbi:MAG: peptidylprolyl isomerase, partial [Planctomycetota bacterium]|nr:peptidylprolyl isomerase [Planctomycetota bacterium]
YGTKIDLQPVSENMKQWQDQMWFWTVSGRHTDLVTSLMSDLKGTDQDAVDQQIQAAQGKPRQPWLVWVAANKAYAEARFADANTLCNRLKSDFPKHLLCAESAFPPQALTEKEDERDKAKDDAKKPKDDKPKYEDAVSGVPVDRLLAAIALDERFKTDHQAFFAGSAPDSKETVVIKIADLGEIEIGLFAKAAKKHVEEFKKNITAELYKGMRIHQIKRARKGQDEETAPVTVHLGHPKSKETDRPKWKEPIEAKEEDILEFEDNKLSFFPGMVAAEQEKEGKSSARRFFMVVNDCASSYDGDYVIFGKIIRGMDILKEIAEGDFLTETEDDSGQGVPARDLLIESTKLKSQ